VPLPQVERQCFNSPIPFVTKRDFCVLRGRATLQTADQDWVGAPLGPPSRRGE
jgi:hypothetical protein